MSYLAPFWGRGLQFWLENGYSHPPLRPDRLFSGEIIADNAYSADIVHAYVVELCKDNQAFYRYSGSAAFIVGIGSLADIQDAGDCLLGIAVILPQLPDFFIICHRATSW